MKPPRKTPEIHTSTFLHQTSNHLSCILNLLPQYCTQYHLNVLDKGIMPVVVAVQAHLIRIYHVVVIPHRQLLIRHLVNLLLCQRKTLNLVIDFVASLVEEP